MNRHFAGLALFTVAACQSGPTVIAPNDSGFRDTAAPIASTTRFEAERFSGNWVMRERFNRAASVSAVGEIGFGLSGGEISSITFYEESGAGRSTAIESAALVATAPGRFVHGTAPFETEYWVFWVDADYRTAAIGTPNGAFGWILDRSVSGGSDRIAAARDIFEWYGYETNLLVEVSQ